MVISSLHCIRGNVGSMWPVATPGMEGKENPSVHEGGEGYGGSMNPGSGIM
jgi:hypothetical protein